MEPHGPALCRQTLPPEHCAETVHLLPQVGPAGPPPALGLPSTIPIGQKLSISIYQITNIICLLRPILAK